MIVLKSLLLNSLSYHSPSNFASVTSKYERTHLNCEGEISDHHQVDLKWLTLDFNCG